LDHVRSLKTASDARPRLRSTPRTPPGPTVRRVYQQGEGY
jgi:hypothetical protein